MTTSYFIITMVVIGAIIGSMTNVLAIYMIFRPYNPIYLLGIKVPFTPGLIPKRQDEIAIQMGELVVKHLLTPEGFISKFKDEQFRNQMIEMANKKISPLCESEMTVKEFCVNYFGIEEPEKKLEEKLSLFVKNTLDQHVLTKENKMLKEIIPSELSEKVEEKIPAMAEKITIKAKEYLSSDQGYEKIQTHIRTYLQQKKLLGNMATIFSVDDKMSKKIHSEIIGIMEQPQIQKTIESFLTEEWEKIQSMTLQETKEWINQAVLEETVKNKIMETISIKKWFNMPISHWLKSKETQITEDWVPLSINKVTDYMAEQINNILHKINIQEIIEQQVRSFSLERLEKVVVSVAKKELKMITLLGAILGGCIGLIQALIVQLLML